MTIRLHRLREQGQPQDDEFGDFEPLSEDDLVQASLILRKSTRKRRRFRREAFEKFMQLETRELISDEGLFSELRYYGIYSQGGMGAGSPRPSLQH